MWLLFCIGTRDIVLTEAKRCDFDAMLHLGL
jgi:hypothetical protein